MNVLILFSFSIVTSIFHAVFGFKAIKIIDVEDTDFEKDIKKWWSKKGNDTEDDKPGALARFRTWLKYDSDCKWLSTEELRKKIEAGRCPNIKETTQTPNKNKTRIIEKLKETNAKLHARRHSFVSYTFKKSILNHVATGRNLSEMNRKISGTNEMKDIEIRSDTGKISLRQGTMVNFHCDNKARNKERKERQRLSKKRAFTWGWFFDNTTELVEWYVNGNEIKQSWFDWRVSISYDGELGIWPVNKSDSGHIECYVNGDLRAAAELEIFTLQESFIKSYRNFGYCFAIFAIIALIILICVSDVTRPVQKIEHVDRMEEFLIDQLLHNTDHVKERIARMTEHGGEEQERMPKNISDVNKQSIRQILRIENKVPKDEKTKRLKVNRSELPNFYRGKQTHLSMV